MSTAPHTIYMVEHIIRPHGDGRAIAYPDEVDVSDDDKRTLTVEEVYREFGMEDVMMLFEDGYDILEDIDPETGDPAIIIAAERFETTIVFPYEHYKYEDRQNLDGTGPIRDSVRLTGDAWVYAGGQRLFSYHDYTTTGGGYERMAENKLENLHF